MSCSFKESQVLTQVLNGYYPAVAISKMNKGTLEKFVLKLVKKTSSAYNFKKPIWWPKDIDFKLINFYLSSDSKVVQVRSTLKTIVVRCSEYFKRKPLQQYNLGVCNNNFYSESENNENLYKKKIERGVKRKSKDLYSANTKRLKPTLINNTKCPPILELRELAGDSIRSVTPDFLFIPNQKQFLDYLKLRPSDGFSDNIFKVPGLQVSNFQKLAHHHHIPFSSDIGRIIISKENHHLHEEFKMRRLEKLDWYLNKDVPKSSHQDYEVTYNKKDESNHYYRFPKRQFFQNHESILITPFILKHFTSVYVKLERVDLKKFQKKLKIVLPKIDLKDYLNVKPKPVTNVNSDSLDKNSEVIVIDDESDSNSDKDKELEVIIIDDQSDSFQNHLPVRLKNL